MSPSQICETSLHIITCEVKGHSLGTKTILAGQVKKNALQNLIRYKPTFVERFFMCFFIVIYLFYPHLMTLKCPGFLFLHDNENGKTSMAFFIGRRSIDKNKYLSTKNNKTNRTFININDRSNILECHEIVNYVSIESLKVL